MWWLAYSVTKPKPVLKRKIKPEVFGLPFSDPFGERTLYCDGYFWFQMSVICFWHWHCLSYIMKCACHWPFPLNSQPLNFQTYLSTKSRKKCLQACNLNKTNQFLCSWHADHITSHFLDQALNLPSFFIYHHLTILTLLILAVCRMHVIHEPCIWPSSPWVLCSSVVRASLQCWRRL